MTIIDAIILGIVQGLTEFIPVSSSGHLVLLDRFTSVESNFEFDVLINIGTLTALMIYFRERLKEIAKRILNGGDQRLARNIVISTVPAVVVGGLFSDLFSGKDTRSEYVVISMLFIVGLLMVIPWKIETTPDKPESLYRVPKPEALYIGLAQVLALIPGTSRSGITILAGRLNKLTYNRAAEYSFLLAIPVMFGAIVKVLLGSEGRDFVSHNLEAMLIGNVVAFVCGMFAISLVMKFLSTSGLWVFGYYRIALAVLLLIIVL